MGGVLNNLLAGIGRLWSKGCLGKAAVIFGALLILGMCRAIVGGTPPAQAPTGQPTQASAQLAAVATAAPTVPPEPTSTPVPTNTPAPTNTPEPTATPTPLPEPIVLNGRGKTVTDPFVPPAPVSRVTFTHKGERNFAVTLYIGGERADLLVNTIGSYEGTRPFITDKEAYLEIDADGDWTATIEPIPTDDTAAAGLEGKGDTVSALFNREAGAVPFAFSHDGERNFAVILYCAGGRQLVANEIGKAQGEVVVRFREGPCLWDVQADGAWSVKPK